MAERMNAIIWPEGYLPGTTENFASNEMIVAGISAADVWPLLAVAPRWPEYYANSSDIRFYDGKGPELDTGVRFFFRTFGFPVEGEVTEYVPPANGEPGRVAWHGWAARAIRVSTCITRGSSRISRAAACASSRRRRRRASPPSSWRTRVPIR